MENVQLFYLNEPPCPNVLLSSEFPPLAAYADARTAIQELSYLLW